jgi:predicted nucleic acid-binding protein
VDDDERQALRAEGLDPDDPAVIAVIDLVRWELSLGTLSHCTRPTGARARVQATASALADLADLPLRRSSHQPFLHRIWDLRHVVAPYGGANMALAEALDGVLVTADARLSRASGVHCEIEAIDGA